MIKATHGIAKKIYPLRRWLLSLSLLATFFCIYIVVFGNHRVDDYLLPSLALVGWFSCLYAVATAFNTLPNPIEQKDRFFTRIKKRSVFGLAWAFAAICLLSMFGLSYLSYLSLRMAV